MGTLMCGLHAAAQAMENRRPTVPPLAAVAQWALCERRFCSFSVP